MAELEIPISRLPPASLPLSGTEKVPMVQGGVTVEASTEDIAALGDGGVAIGGEVTDSIKRTSLKLNSNWVNPNDSGDSLYFKMTTNKPTGQLEHDYYIGLDSSTNTAYKYTYEKIDSVLEWIRIPLQISISGI